MAQVRILPGAPRALPRRHLDHLAIARDAITVAGRVLLEGNQDPLVAHGATVRHLQVRPAYRRRGLGGALMSRCQGIGRDLMHLDQLHLTVRSGQGLEDFYIRRGWRETGRWPGARRLAPDDVLLVLAPL